ncbi:unnamed protein product [Allacma fusca]|uniref:Uncharacterized protein n=1 Tax=Allacma fusca TaxID=39272 RepID=A0A8J2KM68_9HEXA|nr:unnamed protein product [Allacma fusca]
MRTKFCRIFILGSIPMGFLTYLLIRPILKKKQESGGFDDFPSFVYKREQFRTWTDNNSTGVIRTRAEYDRTINEIVSDEFHDV